MSSKYTENIHYIAENFLRDPWAKDPNQFTTREIELDHLRVVLAREQAPRFFCGMKRDQSPIWAHEQRFAKPIQYTLSETWQSVLESKGHVTAPIWADPKTGGSNG